MCIILYNPAGQIPTPHIIANSVLDNPHGFGFYDIVNDELTCTMNREEMAELMAQPIAYIAHCRYATRGAVNRANIHPFKAGKWLVFMNGTIEGLKTKANDTRKIAKVLSRLGSTKGWVELLSLWSARFILINRETKEVIQTGDWIPHEGIFYSKDSVLDEYCEMKPTGNKHFVAVYGTLKKGRGNSHFLDGATFIDECYTEEPHRLCIDGLPYLVAGSHEEGKHVQMELYEVNDDVLENLDSLEGHPRFYKRERLDCITMLDQPVYPWVYQVDESYDTGEYVSAY